MRITRNIFILAFFLLEINWCKTTSYLKSPNNFTNENCQVVLSDGSQIDGKLSVQFETGQNTNNKLKIITADNSEKRILITDIKYFKHQGQYYFPKEINLESYTIPVRDKMYLPDVRNILFLRSLTGEDAKLQLFELFRSRSNSIEAYDQYDYYISFKNENRFVAWSIRGNKFFPKFEEKMSSIVSDCPALAEKIKNKETGYIVKQFSVDARKNEIIKKIVEEYNKCK
jgi:hypothetical protein